MNRAVVVGFVVGMLIAAAPLGVYSYLLNNEVDRLNDEVSTFRGVTLRTDKDVYAHGENVTITLDNQFDREIFLFTFDFFQLEMNNGSWVTVYSYALPEYLLILYTGKNVQQAFSVANRTSFNTSWNQTIIKVSWNFTNMEAMPVITYVQVLPGTYRLKMTISLRYGSLEGAMPESSFAVVSRKFDIR